MIGSSLKLCTVFGRNGLQRVSRLILRFAIPLCVSALALSQPSQPVVAAEQTRSERQETSNQRQLQEAKRLDEQMEKLYLEAKYEEAIKLAQQSLEIRKRILPSDDLLLAESLHNLAILYLAASKYTKAEPLLRQSLNIREQKLGKEDLLVASSLNALGGLYQGVGNYETAETLFKRALAIRQAKLSPTHGLVVQAMNNLALLYQKKEDYQTAEKLFIEAYENLKKSLGHENHPMIGNILNNLAVVYQEQGDIARAESFYQHALPILEKLFGPNHLMVANTLHNLAVLHVLKKDFARAEPLFQRSLDAHEKSVGLRHPSFANVLASMGIMYEIKGDAKRTAEFITRASDIHEQNLSLVIAAGSEQDKRLYMDTLDEQNDVAISLHIRSAPESVSAARLALTTILRRKGRVLDAMTDSIEALRRQSKREDQKLLVQLSAVRSQLATLVLNGPGQRSRDQYDAEITTLQNETHRLEAVISERSAKFNIETQPATLERIQLAVPPDAALIEISTYRPFDSTARIKKEAWAPQRYVAYVLRREGAPMWVELGDVSSIDKSVAAFREILASPSSDVRSLARSLDEQVMRPIRKLLGPTTKVFLSPDGALNLLPFAALVDEKDHFLVETYRMSYLTSGRDLLRLQAYDRLVDGPQVALANPNFDRSQSSLKKRSNAAHQSERSTDLAAQVFEELPGTAKEAQALKKILPRLVLLTGSQATETAIKQLKRPAVLHVATHGFFLPDQSSSRENPLLRSGLILAGANQREGGAGEDGILTALEASGLDLWGTRIVVLSACETGVGDVRNGDGVYGLRRALVLAGAESQVISLWKVDDEAAKDLMVDYYKKLQRGIGRTEALRQVQLSMLWSTNQTQRNISRGAEIYSVETTRKDTSRSHPYYWASFIQSGDWRSLQKTEKRRSVR